MAGPNYALRNLVCVNPVGTDDPGYNAVGHPMTHLTIASALADLLANYAAPSATNPCVISVGAGVFTVPAFQLPPWVWIVGTPDGEGNPVTILNLTGNITLATGWNAGITRGGLTNLTLRVGSGAPHLDFTLPAPSAGNPVRVVQLQTLRFDLELLNFQATGTGDAIQIDGLTQDGNLTHNITLQGGTQAINNLVAKATTTISSTAAQAATVTGSACSFAALVLTKNAAALTVTLDAVSVPILANLTLNGGAVFVRGNDANGEGYTPSTPANWPSVPATVQQALDDLAGGGGGVSGNGTAAATNNTGNTTITPSKATWTQYMTFTGAAGTRIMILDVAAPPTAGQTIDLFIAKTDGAGVVVEVRNAAAGGTLLATFLDGTGVATALGRFIYGTIATGYAADAWVPVSYQIPATV